MTCATCGAILTGTARFCASCGAPRPDAAAKSEVKPSIAVVDPLAMTAPDAFAETANADTRAELERALKAYDEKQKAGSTKQGAPAPPQVATQEMRSVPSPNAPPPVSPKAASHVVPVQSQQGQQPRTAAMPASAHRVAVAQPSGPAVNAAQGSSPQARIPLAPGSSGGLPAMSAGGPPGPSGPGGPRLSPVPMPPPVFHAAGQGGGPRGPAPSLAPGLAVSVNWANGQRYRGTIVQMMGTRALIVFPDGQQHWVEMSYITPA